MSTTTSASSSSPTCGTGSIYVLPTQDAACAIPNTDNATSIMDKCCTPAPVESYSDDCGLYCLGQKQSLGDLLECLTSNGADHGDVFCNDKMNATATASATGSATDSATKTGSGSGSDSTSSDSAAGVTAKVSKGGLSVLGVVLGAVVLGAF